MAFRLSVILVFVVLHGVSSADPFVLQNSARIDAHDFDSSWQAYRSFDGEVFQARQSFGDHTGAPFSIRYEQMISKLTFSVPDVFLDEGVDFYLVNPGDTFGAASIARRAHTPLQERERSYPEVSIYGESGLPVPPGSIPSLDVDFYLGYATSETTFRSPPIPATRDVFGWMLVRASPTDFALRFPGLAPPEVAANLTVIDSAAVFGGSGIVVGTTRAVPEPTTSIGATAVLACSLLSRRPRSLRS